MERVVIFNSKAELEAMTRDQAIQVVIAAADNLRNQLDTDTPGAPYPYHFLWSDDGLDYMDAAATHWCEIFKIHQDSDGQWDEAARKELARHLLTEVELASDGEFRLWILGKELRQDMGWEVWDDEG
jgi:hypothetical protein